MDILVSLFMMIKSCIFYVMTNIKVKMRNFTWQIFIIDWQEKLSLTLVQVALSDGLMGSSYKLCFITILCPQGIEKMYLEVINKGTVKFGL